MCDHLPISGHALNIQKTKISPVKALQLNL